MKRYGWLALLLVFALACALTKPTSPPTPSPTPTEAPSGEVPNPASAYCLKHGGVLELKPTAEGVVGYCRFADGSVCEEWAYYRGECAPGAVSTPQPWVTPPAEALQGLTAAVAATQPAQAFDCGYRVLPLAAPAEQAPLWAVYSCGMTNWNLNPAPAHFLAIYTLRERVWTELARYTFDQDIPFDFIPETGSVQQVPLDPNHVCIELNGGVGAHGGSYAILRFDGKTLEPLISNSASSMGAGYTADLNFDGQLDVVLDRTDDYVFCYACGVRKIAYSVYTWDPTLSALREIILQPVGNTVPDPLRTEINRAVTLAQANLWRDAQAQINKHTATLPDLSASDQSAILWLKAYINLHAQARAQAITQSGYPLLQYVYYGDYEGAVALMRKFTPQQLFDRNGPLVAGTPVDMAPETLAQEMTSSAAAALQVQPDLAAAYFLRGWATYLADPQSSAARKDLQRAQELAPDDPLYLACAAYVK